MEDFEYGRMWRYYRNDAGTPIEGDVFVHEYKPAAGAKKYGSDDTLQPFLHRSMQVSVLDSDDPLSGAHGAFVAYDRAPLSSWLQTKKNLFVVTPVLHGEGTPDAFFAADHYSFLVNRGVVENKQLQFHRTEYVPYGSHDLKHGSARRLKCFMPLRFPLPETEAAFLASGLIDRLSPFSSTLFEMFTRPWRTQSGAGRQATLRRRRRRLPAAEGDFDHIWRRLPIYRLLVIGIPSRTRGAWDVTMIVTDNYRDERYMEDTHVFRVHGRENLWDAIGKQFEGLHWDDFTPVPRDSFA